MKSLLLCNAPLSGEHLTHCTIGAAFFIKTHQKGAFLFFRNVPVDNIVSGFFS
jgi:hypothetical protein